MTPPPPALSPDKGRRRVGGKKMGTQRLTPAAHPRWPGAWCRVGGRCDEPGHRFHHGGAVPARALVLPCGTVRVGGRATRRGKPGMGQRQDEGKVPVFTDTPP